MEQTVKRLWRSERELRDGLEDTLKRQRPTAPRSAIAAAVDEFLESNDWDDDVPELWKQRWRRCPSR